MSIPGAASPLFIGAAAADAAAFQIDRSLRFNKADSAYLNRTPSSAGNRKTWTWSGWVKRANSDSDHHLFVGDKASSESLSNSTFGRFYIAGNGKLYFSGYTTGYRITSALLRDPAAWYHLVAVLDTTQSTADDRVKIYINGVQVTEFDTKNNPSQNDDLGWNTATPHTIGARSRSGTIAHYHDGYLAEIHFIDGVSGLSASDFGEYDDNNVWQPKEYSGSYGTNGFYLKFADNSSNAALGTDSSGNSNTWTVNNLSATGGRDYTSEGSTSGSFYISAGGAASKMFDGSASTGAFSQTGTATFTFGGSTITASSSLQVRAFKGDSSGANVLVNGTDISSLLNAQSGGGYSTVNITSTLGGAPINLSNVSLVNAGGGSGNIAQIFVDGAELIDGGASDNDSLIDTPTNYEADSGNNGGNYPTWNPLDNGGSLALTNGNLDAANTAGAHNACRATIKFPSTGKWYYEASITTLGGACCIGVENSTRTNPNLAQSGTFFILVNSGGSVQKYNEGSVTNMSGMGTPAQGGILQVAYDADADKLWLGMNNNWMGSGSSANGNPSAGSEASISSVSEPFPVVNLYTSALAVNFGQRSFSYAAPTNFKALCTTNLPDPTIADGSTAFDAVTYTGDGNSPRDITGYSFSPDLVWYKQRDSARDHQLYDIVRGAGTNKSLASNTTYAEDGNDDELYGYLSAFNSDGFEVTTGSTNDNYNNNSGSTYVAWAWDGGTSTVSNTDGSITSNVRASQTNGFSIVTYTGNGTANSTVGHGLNAAPSWIIIKNRDSSPRSWMVLHTSAGLTGTTLDGSAEYNMLKLESSYAAANLTNDNIWNPTNTTFKINGEGTGNSVNYSGDDYVAYVWAPVEGYSAFGSYTGNGSTDGPFVYTGFRPRWILIKRTDTSGNNWILHDTARDSYNAATKQLLPSNFDAVTDTSVTSRDILSNGFKLRGDNSGVNGSGAAYIYACFAEHPFKTARAR